MRKDFGNKPWIYPMPVLILCAYDKDGNANAMNAAWGGIYDDDEIMICLAHDHKTTKNIKVSKAFTVSSATKEYTKECDYLGIVSGNNETNKLDKCRFTITKSKYVNAPIINELPFTLECELKKFNEDGICIGKIKNVSIDESVLNGDKVDINKLNPISFDPVNHDYLLVKDIVGKAFNDGKDIK